MSLTEAELVDIQARCDAATRESGVGSGSLLLHARDDIPRLLAALRDARSEVERLNGFAKSNARYIGELQDEVERLRELAKLGVKAHDSLLAEVERLQNDKRVMNAERVEREAMYDAEVERLKGMLSGRTISCDGCSSLAEAKALLRRHACGGRGTVHGYDWPQCDSVAAWLKENDK